MYQLRFMVTRDILQNHDTDSNESEHFLDTGGSTKSIHAPVDTISVAHFFVCAKASHRGKTKASCVYKAIPSQSVENCVWADSSQSKYSSWSSCCCIGSFTYMKYPDVAIFYRSCLTMLTNYREVLRMSVGICSKAAKLCSGLETADDDISMGGSNFSMKAFLLCGAFTP